jgi:hypothetical protein
MISCTCGGMNENCFKCFGRGYYDSEQAELPEFHASIKLKKSSKKLRSPKRATLNVTASKGTTPNKLIFVKCPVCGLKNTKSFIIKHIIIEHPKFKNELIASRNGMKLCKFCNRLVPIEMLNDHTCEIQKLNNSKNSILDPKQNDKNINKMVKCRYCHCSVRTDRLIKHLYKMHPTKATYAMTHQIQANIDKNKYSYLKNAAKMNSDKQINATCHYSDKQEKNFDSSRDYYTFRENGRFGSHPSFDSMDDD